VVVPFRQQQPDYQRRWRWCRRLREIREKTSLLGGEVLAGLCKLVCGAERLIRQASGAMQTGVIAGEKLGRAVAAVRATITALEQLEASTSELQELGL
jgi:hypothetical protein